MKELLIKCDSYKLKMFIDGKEVEVSKWVIEDGILDHEIRINFDDSISE